MGHNLITIASPKLESQWGTMVIYALFLLALIIRNKKYVSISIASITYNGNMLAAIFLLTSSAVDSQSHIGNGKYCKEMASGVIRYIS